MIEKKFSYIFVISMWLSNMKGGLCLNVIGSLREIRRLFQSQSAQSHTLTKQSIVSCRDGRQVQHTSICIAEHRGTCTRPKIGRGSPEELRNIRTLLRKTPFAVFALKI
jgi:hypothetical protein